MSHWQNEAFRFLPEAAAARYTQGVQLFQIALGWNAAELMMITGIWW